MKIESLSLRTRLGRRVFFLFVICALLPIAITCVLSVIHLSNVSRERQAQRLKEFSETYGLGVLQRLEAADVAIGLIGRGGKAALDELRRDPSLASFILAATTVYADGTTVTAVVVSVLDEWAETQPAAPAPPPDPQLESLFGPGFLAELAASIGR